MRKNLQLGFGVMLLVASLHSTAQAAMLTWRLHDVRFTDGAVANGFIDFDPTRHCGSCSDLMSNWDITLTSPEETNSVWRMLNRYAPTGTSTARYSEQDGKSAFTFVTAPWSDAYVQLDLLLVSPLPRAGGPIALDLTGSQENFAFYSQLPGPPTMLFRTATNGELIGSAIPEPSLAAWMALAIVSLLLGATRRQWP